jgi:hypothetical protein
MRELRQLEARAEALRAEAGMPSLKVHRTTKQRQHENRVMESARRTQLLSLCGVHSLFAAHVVRTVLSGGGSWFCFSGILTLSVSCSEPRLPSR